MIRVKAAFFSFTPPAPPDDDGSYLRWHLLDHMPEQYQLPGIQLGLRYLADGPYLQGAHRRRRSLADIGNLVNYLVGDPVQGTLDDFMPLGRRLPRRVASRSAGLAPLHIRRCCAGTRRRGARLAGGGALPAAPRRPRVVEEPAGASRLAAVAPHRPPPGRARFPGVAGVWMYGSTQHWSLHRRSAASRSTRRSSTSTTTRLWSARLRPLLEERWATGVVRPLFAGPLRSMVEWEVWSPEWNSPLDADREKPPERRRGPNGRPTLRSRTSCGSARRPTGSVTTT